jgi:hypothetical protein
MRSTEQPFSQQIYGSGLCIAECVLWSLNDLPCNFNSIHLHGRGGDQDRIMVLPLPRIPTLGAQAQVGRNASPEEFKRFQGYALMPTALAR